MSSFITDLFWLHAKYPGMFTVVAALAKALFILSMAWSLALLLIHRSARVRCWVWRVALMSLGLIALWPLRPSNISGLQLPITTENPASAGVLDSRRAEPSADKAFGANDLPYQPERDSLARDTPSSKTPPSISERFATEARLPTSPGILNTAREIDNHLLPLWLTSALLIWAWKSLRGMVGRIWLGRGAVLAPADLAACFPSGVECRITSRTPIPLLTGTRWPVIWLPEESAAWSPDTLQSVISHEAAHVRRRDVFWQTLGTFCACLWWWLPPVWTALHNLKSEAELAADDEALAENRPAADYAKTLVEIASRAPAKQLAHMAVAMSGAYDLEHRIRAILASNRWRNRIGHTAGLALCCFAVLSFTTILVSCKERSPTYVSMAKLVAAGRGMGNTPSPLYREYLEDFFGTIIETLESSEMRRRATERVTQQHADLSPCETSIRVVQNKGSAIFNVTATGTDARYTTAYLDMLLEEFMLFRESMRDMQKNKALLALTEDLKKHTAAVTEGVQELTEFKRKNAVSLLEGSQDQISKRLSSLKLEKHELELALAETAQALKDLSDSKSLSASKPQLPSAGRLLELTHRGEEVRAEVDARKARDASDPKLPDLIVQLEVLEALETKHRTLLKTEATDFVKTKNTRLTLVEQQIAAASNEAIDHSKTLAEHDRLQETVDEANKSLDKVRDLIGNFEASHNMSSDAVTIMERASPAIETKQSWW